jgi:transposase
MKNKYLKGAHISEGKFRELLRLFCEDLTATQIANISGISRVTINNYLRMIRGKIAQFCEDKNPVNYLNDNDFASYSPTGNLTGHQKRAQQLNTTVFGIYKTGSGIFTNLLVGIDKATINEIIRSKKLNGNAGKWYDNLKQYSGIANFSSYKLIRINHQGEEPAKGSGQIDEIDFFWGLIKGRLTKFRGMNNSTLYLHVKESEFRYNYRNNDIFNLLNDIIQQQPLHYSLATTI